MMLQVATRIMDNLFIQFNQRRKRACMDQDQNHLNPCLNPCPMDNLFIQFNQRRKRACMDQDQNHLNPCLIYCQLYINKLIIDHKFKSMIYLFFEIQAKEGKISAERISLQIVMVGLNPLKLFSFFFFFNMRL